MKEADKRTLHPDRWMQDDEGILGECHHGNQGRHNLITMGTQRAGNSNLVEHQNTRSQAFLAGTLKRGWQTQEWMKIGQEIGTGNLTEQKWRKLGERERTEHTLMGAWNEPKMTQIRRMRKHEKHTNGSTKQTKKDPQIRKTQRRTH